MVFLQGYGVSPAFAARIYKRYGAAAIARVRENPYRLAFDVWGIGFRSADKLAAALGIARDAPARLEAGVRQALEDEANNGHLFVPRRALAAKAGALLEQDEADVTAAIDRLARAGEVAVDASVVDDPADPAVYETSLYRAEAALSAGLRRLRRGAGPAADRRRRRRDRRLRARRRDRAGAAAGRGGAAWRSAPRRRSSPAVPASARRPSCAASCRSCGSIG